MDVSKVWAFFEKFDRDALPYLIDGLVVKIDDITEQNTLGATSGCPNGQIAIKFKSKTTETKIDDITWQVGLSGRITPVAELVPADLDGVTISRATLNNLDYIKSLGLEIGDTILLARANDVIPRILRVTKKSNSGKGIRRPRKCPKCKDFLEKDGAYLICVNSACAGAVFGDIMTWIKINNMLGFGQRVVAGLIEEGVKDAGDLYTATNYALEAAAGSQKVGTKLRAMIDKTKEVTLDKFLAGLNIPHLGKTNSKRLKKKFEFLQNVLDATEDELADIQGIKTTAGTLHKGLAGKTTLIAKILKHVTIKQDSGPLKGFSFTMTGLRNHNGQDLATLIEDNGGELKSGVSKELDYLIIKDTNSTSAKAVKARKYGTKLISPDDFMAMI
jgi:DNA ligase (NAD+)